MEEPDELAPEEVLTEEEELTLKKTLEDLEPLSISEYINVIAKINVDDDYE